jgi:vacuolar-type H+-ATPase subunit F/Vma7
MTVGRVAALGERSRVAGLALAGAVVVVADAPEAVRQGWRSLPGDVDLVILTSAAAEALEPGPGERTGGRPLIVVMPP